MERRKHCALFARSAQLRAVISLCHSRRSARMSDPASGIALFIRDILPVLNIDFALFMPFVVNLRES
jgi:hypothetical protein